MIDTLENYVRKIDNFSSIRTSDMITYFAYYLTLKNVDTGIKAKQIFDCFTILNIPPYSNIPRYLSENAKRGNKQQKFIKNKVGDYTLTRIVREQIEKEIFTDRQILAINKSLRNLAGKLASPSEKNYLDEAILTFEAGAYRAAILMVWLLTIDHLYEFILKGRLVDFISAMRRANITKSIHSKDDFAELKESQFIEVCKSAGIISNDVRKILEIKLGIRNSFAHPSNISLPKSKALEFIEDLVENVVLKY